MIPSKVWCVKHARPEELEEAARTKPGDGPTGAAPMTVIVNTTPCLGCVDVKEERSMTNTQYYEAEILKALRTARQSTCRKYGGSSCWYGSFFT